MYRSPRQKKFLRPIQNDWHNHTRRTVFEIVDRRNVNEQCRVTGAGFG